MDEIYSIQVCGEVVEIYGDLTIEEAFDFINFFDKKGYKSLVLGNENSTIRMMRKNREEIRCETRKKETEEEESMYYRLYESEKQEHEKTKNKLKQAESLLKEFTTEASDKFDKLKKNIESLEKQIILSKLQNDKVVQDLLNKEFGNYFGEI